MEICAEDLSRKEKAASAIVLIAFFDQNVQHQKEIKLWLTRYTMQRETDLERIWFTSSDAVEKLEKYAGGVRLHLCGCRPSRNNRKAGACKASQSDLFNLCYSFGSRHRPRKKYGIYPITGARAYGAFVALVLLYPVWRNVAYDPV